MRPAAQGSRRASLSNRNSPTPPSGAGHPRVMPMQNHLRARLVALSIAFSFSGSAFALSGQMPGAQYALGDVPLTATFVAEPPDIAKFVAEDGKSDGGAFRYGVVVPVQGLAIRNGRATHGERVVLGDGRVLWRMAIVSPGAKSLDFHFARVSLPEDAELYIANADRSVVRGPVSAAEIQADGRFFSAYVPGDTATIEVVAPAARARAVSLEVAGVTHAYR